MFWDKRLKETGRKIPVVYQLDGAPPHFSRNVSAFLDREFPDRWIRIRLGGGSIPGPLVLQILFLWVLSCERL